MRCRDLMQADVQTLDVNETAQSAAAKMRDHDVGFLPVVSSEREVVGTLTDRDLCIRLVAEGHLLSTPVADVMTGEVISVSVEDDAEKARALMSEHQVSRIVCLSQDGALAGVISLADLVRQDDERGSGETVRHIKESPAQHA
ncbi:MAG TPA: CBS domain-containing protein [Myxococcota bacterium]|nr:CBS domain-containing protein [Myxococcota bacterium]